MAFLRTYAVAFLCLLLLLQLTDAYQMVSTNGAPSISPAPQPHGIDCGNACAARCAKSKRPNLCQRACGSCCQKCKCVPAGTYGNYETCPCYFHLTTRRNVRKCP